MKLCQFCNEFACGQSGTKAISEHCGDKNMKIYCAVFSHSQAKAIAKINEITANKTVECRHSRATYCVETDNEIWEWINPNSNIRGIRPIKAYIDKDLSLRICEEYIAPLCVFAVEVHYF